jgi:hypothetical protein
MLAAPPIAGPVNPPGAACAEAPRASRNGLMGNQIKGLSIRELRSRRRAGGLRVAWVVWLAGPLVGLVVAVVSGPLEAAEARITGCVGSNEWRQMGRTRFQTHVCAGSLHFIPFPQLPYPPSPATACVYVHPVLYVDGRWQSERTRRIAPPVLPASSEWDTRAKVRMPDVLTSVHVAPAQKIASPSL